MNKPWRIVTYMTILFSYCTNEKNLVTKLCNYFRLRVVNLCAVMWVLTWVPILKSTMKLLILVRTMVLLILYTLLWILSIHSIK